MRSKILGAVGIATVAVAVAAGCSGKSSGASNTVTGTIGGSTFVPKSGSFGIFPEGENVAITSTDPDFCANATANNIKANTAVMAFLFGQAVNSTSFAPASSTGPYTIYDLSVGGPVPPKFIGGEYASFDNSCQSPSFAYLTTSGSPTIDLTKVTASAVNGKGTGVKMTTGDTIDLSLALKSCPGIATIFTSNTNGCLH